MSKDLNFIDLFAGAGGLSEGFIRAGFTPVAHVEMNKEACDTLRTRLAYHYLDETNQTLIYNQYLKGEIERAELWNKVNPQGLMDSVIHGEITNETIYNIFERIDEQRNRSKIDVIIGGPPCQAYSLVGRSRDPNGMKNDKRNYLFRYYGQFLERYKPKYFVFENVLGLLTAGNAKYLNEMLALFRELGYSIDHKVLQAEDFGVLQKRRRVIIIGRRGKQKLKFPKLENAKFSGEVKKDLFYDLPYLGPGDEKVVASYENPVNGYLQQSGIRNGVDFVTQHLARPHNERDLEIYAIAIEKWLNEKKRLKYDELPKRLQTHNNRSAFLDRYKVVDPTGYSHTVVAHIAKDGHYYIYPDRKQVRSISVREAARLQSFPDDYFFEGGRSAAFKQIGNAVPPLMAKSIAKTLIKMV
jgi:DNA (cytosine-5)-methyltransferase 1